MTPYNHLTDRELVSMVKFWPATMPALTALERELGARLANAVDTLEDNEANLAALQAKYRITASDLIECDLCEGGLTEITPPPHKINSLDGAHP